MFWIDRYKELKTQQANLARVCEEWDFAGGFQVTITALGRENATQCRVNLTEGFEDVVRLMREGLALELELAQSSMEGEHRRLSEFLKEIGNG